MCVTVAMKLPRNRESGEPEKDAKWTLFKIRDRAYDPTYVFKTYDDGNEISLFLVDKDTDWSECIRINTNTHETSLMFVNSALNNSVDVKDGKRKGKGKPRKRKKADHGLIARRVARSNTLLEAVETFKNNKFDGCTFISNGKRCFLVESSLPSETKLKLRDSKKGTYRNSARSEDFITTVEEITENIAVRTNHGVTNTKAGYQEKDGISYESSKSRREIAETYIRNNVYSFDDIIPAIDKLGNKDINKDPRLRPRRIKEDIVEYNLKHFGKDPRTVIYTTSAFVLCPNGKIYLKMYNCNIDNMNVKRIFSNNFPIKVNIIN